MAWPRGATVIAQPRDAHGRQTPSAVVRRIEALYAGAESREDVENIELRHHDESYRTPFMANGLQVHMPHTAYAHWQLLRRILTGGGAVRVQASMDMEPINRAAFLCAFKDEVKRGDAHVFHIRYDKFSTVDEREAILAESRRRRQAFAKTPPPTARRDRREVSRRMMKAQIPNGQAYGRMVGNSTCSRAFPVA